MDLSKVSCGERVPLLFQRQKERKQTKNSSRKTTAIYYDNLYILTFPKNNLLNPRKQVNRFSLAQAYHQKNFLKAGYPPQI